jgi:hypothetical protein
VFSISNIKCLRLYQKAKEALSFEIAAKAWSPTSIPSYIFMM